MNDELMYDFYQSEIKRLRNEIDNLDASLRDIHEKSNEFLCKQNIELVSTCEFLCKQNIGLVSICQSLKDKNKSLRDALEAVLIFHSCFYGNDEAKRFQEITGQDECTTKNLCDHIKKVLE